ncbi:MAG: endonuclease Q family protein [Patescibacteria group bacterium]|nr:endonuclease Q family protein [Patescibacteria group bacterium]MDD4304799.1 endonuclease Q family protein [Patescibacteria group bacterium]MDD4695851.1 endonuclease Q family protein [Patescibacteria group bacterium]
MQKVITDLHIHSRFSRACSKHITIKNLANWAEIKGIDILSTSDFTHPKWLEEIKETLEDNGDGLFHLKDKSSKTHFILSTEISCIYKKGAKTRRLHLCILLSNLNSVYKFIKILESKGKNLKSDGRPILGIDAKDIVDIALSCDEKALVIPAHIWTPWFAVLGSKSGFDSIEECFEDYTKYIYALETGLSSSPNMNWLVSSLDKFLLVSNSDAHSLENLGREANAIMIENFSYDEIYKIIKNKNKKKFLYTIEFYPQEGIYYNDGHRNCKISFDPQQSKKNKNICPICKKPLTIGVLNRVMQLADRNENDVDKIKNKFIPYKSLVPLKKIISEIKNVGENSKKVNETYFNLIKKGKNEFNILLDANYEEIKNISNDKNLVDAIYKMRSGEISIKPGYDGTYGKVKIFTDEEKKSITFQQKTLF